MVGKVGTFSFHYRDRITIVDLEEPPYNFHTHLRPFFQNRWRAFALFIESYAISEKIKRLTIVDQTIMLAYPREMKLSEKEGQVLACARLCADAPIPEIAKKLGVKESSVRSITKRLHDSGIIEPLRLINVSKLGYTEYDVTCGLALRGASERKKFFDYLSRSKQVSQILEAAGPYRCTFTVCAKTPSEVDDFLAATGEKFGPIFVNESIGVCLRYSIFPPKYLSSGKFLKNFVTVTTETADSSVDDVDRRILTTLSRNPAFSDRELARYLGMPISTVSYRLKSLSQKGVIVANIYLVRPHYFEHQMFRVYLSVRSLNPQLKRQVASFAKEHPHITYLIEWLGDWQFGFGIMVAHSSQASELVNQIYDLFGDCLNELALFPTNQAVKMEFFPFD